MKYIIDFFKSIISFFKKEHECLELIYLTQTEYDNLSLSEKNNGNVYCIVKEDL